MLPRIALLSTPTNPDRVVGDQPVATEIYLDNLSSLKLVTMYLWHTVRLDTQFIEAVDDEEATIKFMQIITEIKGQNKYCWPKHV